MAAAPPTATAVTATLVDPSPFVEDDQRYQAEDNRYSATCVPQAYSCCRRWRSRTHFFVGPGDKPRTAAKSLFRPHRSCVLVLKSASTCPRQFISASRYKAWRNFVNSKKERDFPNPRIHNNVEDVVLWLDRLKGDGLNIATKCVQFLFFKRKSFPLTGSATARRRRLQEFFENSAEIIAREDALKGDGAGADADSSPSAAKRSRVSGAGGAGKGPKKPMTPAEERMFNTAAIRNMVEAKKAAGQELTDEQREKLESMFDGMLDKMLAEKAAKQAENDAAAAAAAEAATADEEAAAAAAAVAVGGPGADSVEAGEGAEAGEAGEVPKEE
jgi:hypothetical protein